MTISQSRAPFERGSKLVRKTVLTDSRFPGTTELLSPASVELKGVRANLEEQVRKIFSVSWWSFVWKTSRRVSKKQI